MKSQRSSFHQAEIDRIMKAAKRAGGVVEIDLRELIVRVHFPSTDQEPQTKWAPDGAENWDD